MNRLPQRLAELRSAGRQAFIPFLTAGDPSLDATGELIDTVIRSGADVVEIGFPYSDPLADGPIIQASYTRALRGGCRLAQIFAAAQRWTERHPAVPFVAMAAFSVIYRRGPETFLKHLKTAGFAGLIVPDLPVEEAGTILPTAEALDLCLIQLVTPTTPPERARLLAEQSRGFLYVVSVTGITGARRELPAALLDQLRTLRGLTTLPLCVGFGVSSAEQVRLLRPHVDGVIVGSALVELLGADRPWPQTAAALAQRVLELKAGLQG
jgi:tryptophan synthase alpha chain